MGVDAGDSTDSAGPSAGPATLRRRAPSVAEEIDLDRLADALRAPRAAMGRGATADPTSPDPVDTDARLVDPSGTDLRPAEPATQSDSIVEEIEDATRLEGAQPTVDSLQGIGGIGATMAARLRDGGVGSIEALAALGDEQIEPLASRLGTFPSRLAAWRDAARDRMGSLQAPATDGGHQVTLG